MRVVVAHKNFRTTGGPEAVSFGATGLLEDAGCEIIPFSMLPPDGVSENDTVEAGEYERFFVSNVDYDGTMGSVAKARAVARSVYSLEARRKFAALLDEVKPDLVHLHNIYHQLSPSIIHTAARRRVPIVMTVHDFKLICPGYLLHTGGEICERCHGGRYYRAIGRRCVRGSLPATLVGCAEGYLHRIFDTYRRHVRLFISPSRFHRRKLIEYGFDGRRIVHLQNFVDAVAFVPRYGGERRIVFFGNVAKEKGVDLLIESVGRVPGVTLDIVGDGPLLADVGALAEKFKAKVEMHGRLAGEHLHAAVGRATAVALPSRVYENCPVSILEAFALGKPVIGPAAGGIPELVDEGVDGLLFNPGDAVDLARAIRPLIDEPDAACAMGRRGRLKVEILNSPERWRDCLLSVYRTVTEKKMPTSAMPDERDAASLSERPVGAGS